MKLYQEFLLGQDEKVKKEVNVAGAVILKINDEGKQSVLLIKRAPDDHWPNVWEFPRGKCDKGDKNELDKCLTREVREETGLKIYIGSFIDKYEYLADEGKRKSTQYNYVCKMDPPNQEIKLSKEHSEFRWIQSVGEVELMVPSEMKKTISQVLNTDNAIVDYPNTKKVIEETQKKWTKS